jgi:hypothetical protein
MDCRSAYRDLVRIDSQSTAQSLCCIQANCFRDRRIDLRRGDWRSSRHLREKTRLRVPEYSACRRTMVLFFPEPCVSNTNATPLFMGLGDLPGEEPWEHRVESLTRTYSRFSIADSQRRSQSLPASERNATRVGPFVPSRMVTE